VAVSEAIPADKIGREVNLLGEIVGLALRRVLACPVEINLMPPGLVARKAFQRRLPFLAVAAVGLVCTMLVSGLFLHVMRALAERSLGSVQANLTKLAGPSARMGAIDKKQAEVYAKVNQLAKPIRLRTEWMETFRDLHSRLLDGMWLTAVRPGAKGADKSVATYLEIKGMGFSDKVSHKAITDFATSLKGVGHFSDDVQIKRIRPVLGTDYVNEFVIEVALKGAPGDPAASRGPGG